MFLFLFRNFAATAFRPVMSVIDFAMMQQAIFGCEFLSNLIFTELLDVSSSSIELSICVSAKCVC